MLFSHPVFPIDLILCLAPLLPHNSTQCYRRTLVFFGQIYHFHSLKVAERDVRQRPFPGRDVNLVPYPQAIIVPVALMARVCFIEH